MLDTPAELDPPEPIDISAELEVLVENINSAYRHHIGGVPPEIAVIAQGLVRLWKIVEHETRRIDNELTEGLLDVSQEN